MKIHTSKFEVMFPGQEKGICSLWFDSEELPQVEEFKYLEF